MSRIYASQNRSIKLRLMHSETYKHANSVVGTFQPLLSHIELIK